MRYYLFAVLTLVPSVVFAEWRATGPFGGSAEIVRFVPNSPEAALAATRNGLIYVSHDGEKSWEMVPFQLQLAGTLHALEIDPAGAWYVGMEASEAWRSGIYKTIDAGRTWTQLAGLKGKPVWSVAIAPSNPKMIAAGGEDGVYVSGDAGETWKRMSPVENRELRPVVSLAFHPTDTNILYAGTTHLPWRTTDGGEHWQSIHSGMLDDSDVFSIVVDQKNPEIVLSSACSGAYRSTAAGAQWSRMPTPHGAFRTYFVALSPSNAIFAGTTLGLFRSLDTGKTWIKVTSDPIRSIAFEGQKVLMASLRGGVLISANGGETVHAVNEGFSNRSLAMLTSAGNVLYASSVYEPGEGGLFRSKDFGETWSHITAEHGAGNIMVLAARPANPNIVYAAGPESFYGSKDGGVTWVHEVAPPGKGTAALVATDDGALLAGTSSGLYRKTDKTAWTLVRVAGLARRVHWMESSGHGRVAMVSQGNAFVSDNNGREWTACGAAPAGAEWYGLSVSTTGDVLAATSHGLLRSADHCVSWTLVKDGLEAGTVNTVLFHPTRPAEAYTTQYGKVLRSVDGGVHWQPLDDRGRDGLYPSALLISPAQPDRLVAMFPRRGIEIATIAIDRTESPQKEKE